MRTEARPGTVDSLLAETDRLRALCPQLVGDTDRAEDLFQDRVLARVARQGWQRGGESGLSVRLVPEGARDVALDSPVGGTEYTFERAAPGRYELQATLLEVGVVAGRPVVVPEGARAEGARASGAGSRGSGSTPDSSG